MILGGTLGWVSRKVGHDGRPRYTAMFRDLAGESRSGGTFGNRRDAARAWQKAEVDLAAGRVLDRRQGMQTLRQYALETWLPNHVVDATSVGAGGTHIAVSSELALLIGRRQTVSSSRSGTYRSGPGFVARNSTRTL
jgi:hypothetical protein